MKPRQHQALSRKVVRLLNAWKDPHSDQAYTTTQAMRSIDIDEQGAIDDDHRTCKTALPMLFAGLACIAQEIFSHQRCD